MQLDIQKSVEVLKSGGTLLYPTDTIWGLGCDATNAHAIQKIFAIKQRSESVPLLVLVDSIAMLERYVIEMPMIADDLIELSEKPITIIFEKARYLPDTLIAADGSIGIRVTKEAFSLELIRKFRRPIVSTSANIHGQPSPSFFKDISDDIKKSVDYVVSYRQNDTSKQKASSIIRLQNNGVITIIRE